MKYTLETTEAITQERRAYYVVDASSEEEAIKAYSSPDKVLVDEFTYATLNIKPLNPKTWKASKLEVLDEPH